MIFDLGDELIFMDFGLVVEFFFLIIFCLLVIVM